MVKNKSYKITYYYYYYDYNHIYYRSTYNKLKLQLS